MKYLYLLLLTVFIASCGAKVDETKVVEDETTTEVLADINNELDTLEVDENIADITKIDAKYTNPAWEVDMVINYTLDWSGTIATINTTATTYDLSQFNDAIQSLVWKTIEEAKNTEITWGSLTTDAFKKALK